MDVDDDDVMSGPGPGAEDGMVVVVADVARSTMASGRAW